MQRLRGRTNDECKTTTVTSWTTTTATKTVTGIESIVTTKTVTQPTTIRDTEVIHETQTVHDTQTLRDTQTILGTTTAWVPTTYMQTKTVVSEYPVTVTVDNTKYTTQSTTIYTTFVTTVTTSYPVVSTLTVPGQDFTQTLHNTETILGTTTIWVPTTYIQTQTIVSEHPVTITVDNTKYTTQSTTLYTTLISTVTTSYPVVSTLTVPGHNVTQTLPGETVTVPGQPSTITLPPVTRTVPGATVMTTTTKTLPASTIHVTESQGTRTITLPAPTVVETRTITLPPTTIERPASTITITPIFDVTLCPAPTGAMSALEVTSNRTFGCDPGYVCDPPKPNGCNFWPDAPDDDYVCEQRHCIPAPPFTNVTWKDCETGYYPPAYGYFNLNPEAFGLSYDIFEYHVLHETINGHIIDITTGNWDSQSSLSEWPKPTASPKSAPVLHGRRHEDVNKWKGCQKSKRGDTSNDFCYLKCNTAFNIAQRFGKTDALCAVDSGFRDAYNSCAVCVEANSPSPDPLKPYIDPRFKQFLDFCDGKNPVKPSSTPATTPDQVNTQEPTVKTSTQADTSTPGFTPGPPSESPSPSVTPSVTVPASTVASSQSSTTSPPTEPSPPPSSSPTPTPPVSSPKTPNTTQEPVTSEQTTTPSPTVPQTSTLGETGGSGVDKPSSPDQISSVPVTTATGTSPGSGQNNPDSNPDSDSGSDSGSSTGTNASTTRPRQTGTTTKGNAGIGASGSPPSTYSPQSTSPVVTAAASRISGLAATAAIILSTIFIVVF
jgi:hypothetical protein